MHWMVNRRRSVKLKSKITSITLGGKRTHFLDNNQEIGLHVPKLHWERKIFIYDKKKSHTQVMWQARHTI